MTRLICAQPATLYYAWQVEVMLQNFIETGINLNFVDVLCAVNSETNMQDWSKLADKYAARFFFYRDDRPQPQYYISSVRPWVLAKHFAKHTYLSEESIFYHDCDMIFSKPIDFEVFEKTDSCYGSDVRWYISHQYILGKGQDILDKMCEIVGISQDIVKENELNCIGAQYLLKNIDADFWKKVYRDSENLFKEITAMNMVKKKQDPNYHELQIWCADMWALLWNLWLRGQRTLVSQEFSFSWGTSTEQDFYDHPIFHNAGVTGPNTGLFFKGDYINKSPFGLDLKIKEGTASKKYYDLIQRVKP